MDPRDIQGDELLAELMRSQSLDGDCAGGALPSLQQQQRPPFSAHVPDRCDSRREASLTEPTRREPLDQADEDGADPQEGSCPAYKALLAEKARRQADCGSRREGSLAEATRREPLDQADEDGTDSQKGSCPTYEALLAEKARRQAMAEGMACPDPSLDRRLAASYLQQSQHVSCEDASQVRNKRQQI